MQCNSKHEFKYHLWLEGFTVSSIGEVMIIKFQIISNPCLSIAALPSLFSVYSIIGISMKKAPWYRPKAFTWRNNGSSPQLNFIFKDIIMHRIPVKQSLSVCSDTSTSVLSQRSLPEWTQPSSFSLVKSTKKSSWTIRVDRIRIDRLTFR